MLTKLRHRFEPRQTTLATVLLALLLPLAAPTLAESILLAGGEKEAAVKDCGEMLAWASEDRLVRNRSARRLNRVAAPVAHAPRLQAVAFVHHSPPGHRLSCGIMAPLRC